MTSLFETCINGRFVLNTTEAQDTSVFLNDGSHHKPSGVNRENQLGTIQSADNFLRFGYDAKSTNGLNLPDDLVQTRQPDLCFERAPFGQVEGPYFSETNMDILEKMDTYPDGSLKNPTAIDYRQTDNQTMLSPAKQAISYQNKWTALRMADLAQQGTMNRIYQYMSEQERQSEVRPEEPDEDASHQGTEGPADPEQDAIGTDEPEEIFEEPPESLIPQAPPAPPVGFGPRGEVGMDLSLRNQALELIETVSYDTNQLRSYAERWGVETRYKRNNTLIPRPTLVNKLKAFIRRADRSVLEELFE